MLIFYKYFLNSSHKSRSCTLSVRIHMFLKKIVDIYLFWIFVFPKNSIPYKCPKTEYHVYVIHSFMTWLSVDHNLFICPNPITYRNELTDHLRSEGYTQHLENRHILAHRVDRFSYLIKKSLKKHFHRRNNAKRLAIFIWICNNKKQDLVVKNYIMFTESGLNFDPAIGLTKKLSSQHLLQIL